MQLLFASGVRDVQYGILQFQLLLVVWFSFLISFSLLLHCCVWFLWGTELKGAFWQCPLLGCITPVMQLLLQSEFCLPATMYYRNVGFFGFIFRVLWITLPDLCFPVSSHPLVTERMDVNSLSASKMGMGCVLAGSGGHVSLSEGKGCFSLLGGRILHSQHLLPCPPLTSYLVSYSLQKWCLLVAQPSELLPLIVLCTLIQNGLFHRLRNICSAFWGCQAFTPVGIK